MPGDSGPPAFAAGHVPPVEALPVVLVPGLLTSPRLFAAQLPELWRFGPVTVADNTVSDTVSGAAAAVLAAAPPRFALAGLSMGGYVALEIMRQAPGRVARLALLDTSARPDTPEQRSRREEQIALTLAGRFGEVPGQQWPIMVGPEALGDRQLRETFWLMAAETGPEAFIRQQRAIMSRPDSRPGLGEIRCPVLVLVGESDVVTPPGHAAEMAAAIPGARQVVISGSGHLTTLEQPGPVTAALVEWLAAPAAG